MALQQDYSKWGKTWTDAYHKIDDSYSLRGTRFIVSVSVYIDSDKNPEDLIHTMSVEVPYTDSMGTKATLYNDIKTQDYFSGAIDV